MRYAFGSPRFWLAAALAMAVPAVVMAQVTGATPITITGPLVAINGATLRVDVNGTQENVVTTGLTAITVDGKVGTVANLKVGMNVKVTASGTTITKVVATTPIVNMVGAITGVNGGNVTVQAAPGPVTYGTTAGTVVTVNGSPSTVADLKPTMKATAATGLGVAMKIVAMVPVVAVAGTITAIALPNVTVQTKTAPATFAVGAATIIKIKGVVSPAANLEVGMTLKASTQLGVATATLAAYLCVPFGSCDNQQGQPSLMALAGPGSGLGQS